MRVAQDTVQLNVPELKKAIMNRHSSFKDFCVCFKIDYTTFCRWNRTAWPIREMWAAAGFLRVTPRRLIK